LESASEPGLPAGQLPAQYDPAATEPAIYARWLQAGCFTADASRVRPDRGDRTRPTDRDERDPYTLVMPPPNVTAILHVGHGLNNTVQDVLVRWGRMKGRETLWVPGTDHAGIATQNIVEKQLAKEGLTRQDIGREAFVARTREFVAETGGRDPRAAARHRLLGRLVEDGVHLQPRAQHRGARGVRAPVRARADLSRPSRHPLVPPLPHLALR
jgi:isoleucyl-tRNA synthetase